MNEILAEKEELKGWFGWEKKNLIIMKIIFNDFN